MRGTRRIDDFTRSVLARSRIEGARLFLPEQMERDDYLKVAKVLKGLGGGWDRKAGCHVFPFPAAELVEGAAANGAYVDRKQELGFFETPCGVAVEMARAVRVDRDDSILEPSAGRGRLIEAAFDEADTVRSVVAVELDPHNAAHLRKARRSRVHVHEGCFLGWVADLRAARVRPVFDVVLMNPPFAGGQDIEHIRAAWGLLKPGGRMAAVCSEGPFFRADRKAVAFREWLAIAMPEADIRELPAATFAAEGTNVAARLIVALKGAA